MPLAIVEVGDDGVIENVIVQVDRLGRESQPAEVDRCIEATGLPVRELQAAADVI